MSEVETRLAEIREIEAWLVTYQHGQGEVAHCAAVELALKVRWLLDQLAQVRTDTIAEVEKKLAPIMRGSSRHYDVMAAVRGVSHEH